MKIMEEMQVCKPMQLLPIGVLKESYNSNTCCSLTPYVLHFEIKINILLPNFSSLPLVGQLIIETHFFIRVPNLACDCRYMHPDFII